MWGLGSFTVISIMALNLPIVKMQMGQVIMIRAMVGRSQMYDY